MPTRSASGRDAKPNMPPCAPCRRSRSTASGWRSHINAGLLFDLPHLDQSGADGIGLFRTELQFMISATFPRLEQQTRLYKAILDAAGDRPVVFRSLDVGGDKVLPYFRGSQEENPAHWLARHPHGARPPGAVPHPDARAAPGRGGARADASCCR